LDEVAGESGVKVVISGDFSDCGSVGIELSRGYPGVE
jgi:hypothetical protein